ncbi:MAG TPA: TlpA disulfide reductase family protein [Solirubrobacteraceae bacterium]|jgi:cytochrome c biogenesis protein CcmG/thiol:disulfide interchange protein DsbE
MSRRVRLLAAVALSAAAIAALAVFGLSSSRTAAPGRPAPALPKQVLIGPRATLAALHASSGGRSTVVVFWASWCVPCEKEAAALERFSRSAAGRGRIVGVNWRDALPGAQEFIRRYRWSFPNVRDGEGTIGNKYLLPGLPTTYVLDADGRIRSELPGPQNGASLTRALAAAEHV